MAMKKKSVKSNLEAKKIKPINYFYAFLILFGGILLTYYIFAWYNVKHEEKLSNSYLITSNTINTSINSVEDFKHILQEIPSSYFVYLSYTNDEYVYDLEKDLKVIIDKYNLNDIFYYINLTDLKMKDEELIKYLRESLEIENIDNVPAILYVASGEIKDAIILDGIKNTKLKASDLEQLLDIYEFEEVK